MEPNQMEPSHATEEPKIGKEASEAVSAIMQVEMAEEVTVYDMFTGQEQYEAHYKQLEERGIALTDAYMGARGREVEHKVGVFVSPKRVGLALLRGHARFNAGNLARILATLP